MSHYAAGMLLRTNPHALYSLPAQFAAQKAIGNPTFFPWAHPAPEAILFAPLSLLSYKAAFDLWAAISVLMTLWSVWLLRVELHALPAVAHLALMAALYAPLMGGWTTGQDHCLFLLLWVFAYRSLRDGREYRAGIFIGLALIRFQFALPVLLLLMVRRVWKPLLPVVLIAVFGMVLSRFLVGPGLVHDYRLCITFLGQSHDRIETVSMPTIRGLLGYFGMHSPAVVLAIDGALLLWAAWATKRMTVTTCLLFAMFIGILVDYHAFAYELVVLVMPLAALLRINLRMATIPVLIFAMFVISRHSVYAFACPVLLAGAILIFLTMRETASQSVAELNPSATSMVEV